MLNLFCYQDLLLYYREQVLSGGKKMIETKTLFDFDAGRIAEHEKKKIEEQKIMALLGRFPTSMLKGGLRNYGGHPDPEWGDEKTWRLYYIKECSRRGIKILLDLKWPIDKNSLYVNIHTGSIKNLYDITTMDGYFTDMHTISSQVWSVIEHWEPHDPDKPNQYKIVYLKNEIKSLKRDISEDDHRSTIKYNKETLKEVFLQLKKEQAKTFYK